LLADKTAKAISLSQINYAGRIYIKIKVKVETIFPRHELRHSSSAKLSKTTEATAETTSSNSKVFGKQKVSEFSATAGHWLIARESQVWPAGRNLLKSFHSAS
jgi:hypothetical protein